MRNIVTIHATRWLLSQTILSYITTKEHARRAVTMAYRQSLLRLEKNCTAMRPAMTWLPSSNTPSSTTRECAKNHAHKHNILQVRKCIAISNVKMWVSSSTHNHQLFCLTMKEFVQTNVQPPVFHTFWEARSTVAIIVTRQRCILIIVVHLHCLTRMDPAQMFVHQPWYHSSTIVKIIAIKSVRQSMIFCLSSMRFTTRQ